MNGGPGSGVPLPVRRVVVLGCAGAGKTTFARRLGARLGAPVICLDAVWRPDWGPQDLPAFRALVETAHGQASWISDGNFAAATFDLRLPSADLIVWLERPRWLCLWRAVTRVAKPGEAHRPADLDRVLRFIWGFDRRNRPLIEAARLAHGPAIPLVRLTSDAQVDRFLASLDGPPP